MARTRREFLGTAAAAAGGAALLVPPRGRGRAAQDAPRRRRRRGRGTPGLSAARRLVRAGGDVMVLEARDRVGGRTLRTSGDSAIDESSVSSREIHAVRRPAR